MKKIAVMALAGMMLLNVTACESSVTSTTTVTKSITDGSGTTTTETKTTTTTTDENGTTTNTTTDTTTSTTANASPVSDTAKEDPKGDAQASEVMKEDLDGEGASDEANRRKLWEDSFTSGAIGANGLGDICYFAYDDVNNNGFSAMLLTTEDGSDQLFMVGDIGEDEEGNVTLTDMDTGKFVTFIYLDPASSDADFAVEFQDGDTYQMEMVDQKTIIDEMMSRV